MSSELIAIRPVKECWVCAKHCAKNFVWSVTNPLRHPPDKRTLNSYALLSHLHFTKENALQHLLSLLFWTRKCMRKHSVLSKIIYISEILVKLYIHPYNMLGVHKQLWFMTYKNLYQEITPTSFNFNICHMMFAFSLFTCICQHYHNQHISNGRGGIERHIRKK